MSSKNTPKKEECISLNSKFSSVNIHESPGGKTNQRNITGYPRIARDLSADIYNNIQQWNNLHVKGAKIIQQIANIGGINSNSDHDSELESLCTTVYDIVNAMQLIVNNLFAISRQMKTLVGLHKTETPMFISWPVDKFFIVADSIYTSYKTELEVKRTVCENIAHSENQNEAMFQATVWAVQAYIDNDVRISLESLLTETGHRSKMSK